MKLYVCWGTWKGATPRPFRRAESHPCGVAHQALLDAGYSPEIVRCFGWKELPSIFNLTPGRRQVKKLTGEIAVPVLVADDGGVIAGSSEIVEWVERSVPARATSGQA